MFTRDDNMVVWIGGHSGHREESGVRFLTLFKMRLSRGPPFHWRLWRMCQVLRADMCFQTVFPEIWPALEVAKAQRTNSSAGKQSSRGTFSCLQKLRKQVNDEEYPVIVEVERLFCKALSSELRVLVENKELCVVREGEFGGLKKSFLRVWVLVEENLRGGDLGCFLELSFAGVDSSL